MENMNNTERGGKRRLIIAAVILVLLVAAGLIFGPGLLQKPVEGGKSIKVEIVHGNGEKDIVNITTAEEYLGTVLMDMGIIEGDEGPYGLFVTSVGGEAADPANEEWWCLTKGGETVMTGVDMTPIADGDAFELTLTVGYDGW